MNHKLSREAVAKLEIGCTSVSRRQLAVLCAGFLAVIVLYPGLQLGFELAGGRLRHWTDWAPWRFWAVLTEVKPPAGAPSPRAWWSYNQELAAALKRYERELERNSVWRALLLPTAQEWMIRWGKTGNESVVFGTDGWLFYAADFDYLAHPGLLRPEGMARRRRAGFHPDSVAAIVDFQRQLEARGIALVVLPLPVKPVLYADRLDGAAGVVNNPDYPEWLARLRRAGVRVIDVAAELAALRRTGAEVFLRTDTHWTPVAMQATARRLAAELGRPAAAPAAGDAVGITARGDIAALLRLDPSSALVPPEQVTVRQVAGGPEGRAEVLLLGDSFARIYSSPELGWGQGGGLPEHLAWELGEPVEVMARNDAGAFATRRLLADALRRGSDPLAGKRLVIWEFAQRELTQGDWRLIELDAPGGASGAAAAEFWVPAAATRLTGVVAAVSAAPRPNSAPYANQLMTVLLTGIGDRRAAVVYVEAMRANRLLPAAHWRPGMTVRVELAPWREYEAEFGGWLRSELADPASWMAEPCWGKVIE